MSTQPSNANAGDFFIPFIPALWEYKKKFKYFWDPGKHRGCCVAIPNCKSRLNEIEIVENEKSA